MPRRPVVIALLLLLLGLALLAPAAPAVADGRRAACRRECDAAITTCMTQGYRRGTCVRELVTRCRRGETICARPPLVCTVATTTTSTSTTTTTTPPTCPIDACDTAAVACEKAACCPERAACAGDVSGVCPCWRTCARDPERNCSLECGPYPFQLTALVACVTARCPADACPAAP